MTFAETLAKILSASRSEIFTALPGIVQTYDPIERTADVIPAIRRPIEALDGTVVHEELPVIPSVPVAFFTCGGASIVADLEPGDTVLLIATTYAIGQWRQSRDISDAGDVRQHHPGSCVALPVLSQTLGASALRIDADEIEIGAGATHPIARGDATQAWIEAIVSAVVALGGAVVPPTDFPTTPEILSAKGLVT